MNRSDHHSIGHRLAKRCVLLALLLLLIPIMLCIGTFINHVAITPVLGMNRYHWIELILSSTNKYGAYAFEAVFLAHFLYCAAVLRLIIKEEGHRQGMGMVFLAGMLWFTAIIITVSWYLYVYHQYF